MHTTATVKGFSLIELLVVIVIIGILAALAVPAYQNYTLKAKITEAIGLMDGFKEQVSVYYADNGTVLTWNNTPLSTNNAIDVSNSSCCNNIYYWKQTLLTGEEFIEFWPDWKTSVFTTYNFNLNASRVYIMAGIDTGVPSSSVDWVCGYDTRASLLIDTSLLPGGCTHTWNGSVLD